MSFIHLIVLTVNFIHYIWRYVSVKEHGKYLYIGSISNDRQRVELCSGLKTKAEKCGIELLLNAKHNVYEN